MSAPSTIHRIEIPTPFGVGSVNAYLVDDEPLTLVDCGPASVESLDALEQGLSEHGYRVADVELLLLTHQHVDHIGLAHAVLERSQARPACLSALASFAASATSRLEDDENAVALMLRHGVPSELVQVLRGGLSLTRHFGGGLITDATALEAGDQVAFAHRILRVVHVPGHSPTDTLFVDDQHGIALGGDHLLATISSNALVGSRPPGAPRRERYPALVTYNTSLEVTRTLELSELLPGHGPTIYDHRALIERRLADQRSRASRILEIVRARPLSAHAIARELWGGSAVTQAYLTLSEVLGHLDILINRGLVHEILAGPGTSFAAS